jgi:hypothetical protein
MIVKTNTLSFEKTMNSIIEYSYGFLEGVQSGKKVFLGHLGEQTMNAMYQYIDVNARMNPKALHHIYEWYQVGSPASRLYNLNYTVSNLGLSFKSQFEQSRSVSNGSDVPFYNKASIMENGEAITISPNNSVLVFDIDGETIFTKKDVLVRDPGGPEVKGSFERVFDEFMLRYFKQSFLRSSGLFEYINNPIAYKRDFAAGSKGGKPVGMSTGFKWIANARIGVE